MPIEPPLRPSIVPKTSGRLVTVLVGLLALETAAALAYLVIARAPAGGHCHCTADYDGRFASDDGLVECGLVASLDEPALHPVPPPAQTGLVVVDEDRVGPGEAITVRVFGGDRLARDAWVGIVPSHVPHGDEVVNDAHDVTWEYVDGRADAIITLVAPDALGEYDVRFNSTDTNGIELSYDSFTVERPRAIRHRHPVHRGDE